MKKLNILHVDDSEQIRSLFKLSLLSKNNIGKIDCANSVLEAKMKMKNTKTDVVVLDIPLPDGSGIDVLKWVKEEHPGTTVIMFSNHSDSYHRKFSIRYGADYFYDKSTEFEKASEKISTLVRY